MLVTPFWAWNPSICNCPQNGPGFRLAHFLYTENHPLYGWFKKAYGGEKKPCYDNSAVRQLHKIITGRYIHHGDE